jgi:RNA polymerase sigma-70 factor (ECF subfamily)
MSVATRRTPEAARDAADNVVPFAPRGEHAGGSDATDATLVARCKEGDEAAFRILMTRHLGAVRTTARRIMAAPGEADDVTQETFLKLWRGAADLTVPHNGLGPWLRRVAANLAIDFLRKSKRLDVTDEVPEQEVPADQLEGLEASDRAGRVEQALARLSERQRVAIGLFHFEELSQRDVAATMEISEDALESLLARARRRLRQLLADDIAELL